MAPIQASELLSLKMYAEQRSDYRKKILAIKKVRRVPIGDHLSLLFENRETIYYQIMEILYVEGTENVAGIDDELIAYNPLIPDGDNWKATMLIEYTDSAERKVQLENLHAIENKIWCRVGDNPQFYAIADEDMSRASADKTSAVHFLRFQLSADDMSSMRAGGRVQFGCSHPHYHIEGGVIDETIRTSLRADLAD